MDPKALSKQATEFLAEHKPGRYWRERDRLSRKLAQAKHLETMRAAAKAKPAPSSGPTHVYVIGRRGHPIKIGIASDPASRLAALQTGCPHKLRLFFAAETANARTVEREAHQRLSAHRQSGEWFDVEPEQAIEVVRALCAG